jgi:hypothetical protein
MIDDNSLKAFLPVKCACDCILFAPIEYVLYDRITAGVHILC